MAAQELVLVDTCIWIQFFNRPQSREKLAVDQLLDEDRAALIGPLLTEVLRGFARKRCGMRWDTANADAGAPGLAGLEQSDRWKLYWQTCLKPTG